MNLKKKIIFCFALQVTLNLQGNVFASDSKNNGVPIIKGYITNKDFNPLKLKVYEIDQKSFFLSDSNLEDNSYTPFINLKVTAENIKDYSLSLNDSNIFVPESTKFIGHISEIKEAKSFDRKGFFKVTFDKAICPDGQIVNLNPSIISKSQGANYIYNPYHHLGKATLSLLGGSLLGTIFSYELGGLGLALASHGYSLAAGAAAGGFIGTASGLIGKGKNASIEPGDELTIIPINEVTLEELKQITCKKLEVKEKEEIQKNENIKIEILSAKQKKDPLGDAVIKVNIRLVNNSNELFRLSNFFLRDSQGDEYTTSFNDFKEDIFVDFPPNQTKEATLEFFVDHPKAVHWLVLKDKNFQDNIGAWKLNLE